MESHKPKAEQTKDALIEAVGRLLARRAAGEISVRDIATEAGVNHGLVHHYFGSKEALIREAVTRTSERIHRARPGDVAGAWSFSLFRQHPDLARVIARVCLDGPHDLLPLSAPSPKVIEARAAAIGAGAARLGIPPLVDPHVAGGIAAAAILGWIVFRPLLDAGFKLPADADEQVARALAMLDGIFASER